MPILTLQKRMHEAGRIRIGHQVPGNKPGKTRPAKLSTFRFTSNDRTKIEHIATILGGTPNPWQNGPLQQHEVITNADTIDVIVPPTDMAFTQFLELWSGGGCQRRCDGQRETITDQPCICGPDPDERECKPTTRLSLMLAQVQGMGLWRIETHGWYAATELAGSVELILSAAGRGHLLPATLRLDKRTVTRPGQPRRDFAVPVLDVALPIAQIAQATAGSLGTGHPTNGHAETLPGASVAELEARTSDTPVPFTPVPGDAPTRDRGSVADQVAAHQQRSEAGPKRTKRSAAQIPVTGRSPRTAAQARAEQPDPPPPDDEDGWSDPAERSISPAQLRKLHAIFTEHDIADRDQRLAISSGIVNRDLSSSKDLTLPEAAALIDTLERAANSADGFHTAIDGITSDQHRDDGVHVDLPDTITPDDTAALVAIITNDRRRTKPDNLTSQQARDLATVAAAAVSGAILIDADNHLLATPEGVTVTVEQIRDLASDQ